MTQQKSNFMRKNVFIIMCSLLLISCQNDRSSIIKDATDYLNNESLIDGEFIANFESLHKDKGFKSIRIKESSNVIKVSYGGMVTCKFSYKDYSTDKKLKDLGLMEIVNDLIHTDIYHAYVDDEGVQINSSEYSGTLFSESENRKTIVSDIWGEVTIEEMLSNYSNPEKEEWAYKLNENWYVVVLQTNM
jgi:major membrane immunogen (membrane-anchored lipoprotein)